MATRTWDATDGNLASTAANWVGGVKPVAGDNVLFDVNSAAHACTFDLALALGSFTMTADYSGTITQAASFSVTGYSQAAGTFTANSNYMLTDSGSFTKSAGTFANFVVNFVFDGVGATFSSNANIFAHIINITGTITISNNLHTDYSHADSALIVSGTMTISAGSGCFIYYPANLNVTGTIAGAGPLNLNVQSTPVTLGSQTGSINCPVTIGVGTGADATMVLGANLTLGNTLLIDGIVDHPMSLDLSASNYSVSATLITIGANGILIGRGSTITCSGFDSSAGMFTQGTSTLITTANGNLKMTAAGAYNLRIADGVTTTLTAALNIYKDLRVMGTLTRGANTVSLLGAGEQTVSGYPDTAITVNSAGPVIFHECAHHHDDVTATAGTLVWTGYGKYITHGNLSISAISRKPTSFDDVQNLNGTLTFDAESRMKDLTTDAGQMTVQSAGVQLGISGKIATAGTFTQNTPTKITRDHDQARLIPFPVQFCVNQPKGWGDA